LRTCWSKPTSFIQAAAEAKGACLSARQADLQHERPRHGDASGAALARAARTHGSARAPTKHETGPTPDHGLAFAPYVTPNGPGLTAGLVGRF